MNAQNINQILDALAARFGTTGLHLWAVLIRQVYIQAATDAIGIILLGACAAITTKYARRAWDKDRADAWTGVQCATAAALLLTTLIVMLTTVQDFAQLFNPEYGALTMVFHAMGK